MSRRGYRPEFRRRYFTRLRRLQRSLDGFLHFFKHEWPHHGYRTAASPRLPCSSEQEHDISRKKREDVNTYAALYVLDRPAERACATGGAPAALLAAFAGVAFVVAVPFDLLPLLRGPAPYPLEWQWGYRVRPAPLPWTALLLSSVVLALLAATGTAIARRHERTAARIALPAAVVLGFALPLAFLAREPAGALRTLLGRTASNMITSYHSVAVSEEARDPLAFLRHHAQLLPVLAEPSMHAAVHPPGAVLFFRAALAACERAPALAEVLLDAARAPQRESAPPLTRTALAAALFGALLLNLATALVAWPLAALSRRLGARPLVAARAALVWVLLPGPSLFAPRFDAAIALPVVAFATLMLPALAASPPPRAAVARTLAAGACAAVALQLSYGAAAFLALGGMAVAAAALATQAPPWRPALARPVALLGLCAIVALALSFGVPALLGGQPVAALRTALVIHHRVYTAPRDYALWLLFNPVDFAALLGLPLAVLALFAAGSALSDLRHRALLTAGAFGLAVMGGIALLVLSGATRGEVGRLWIPLMPFVLIAAWQRLEREGRGARSALLVAALVALSTFAIASAWRL